jgi:chromosome segregation protein
MTQLEKQAQRAGEYERLSAELMHALREYYEHKWERAQESLTVARAAHDQAQAEFLQARVSLETVQHEMAQITDQLEESRKAATEAAAEKERLVEEIRTLERRLAVGEERVTLLRSRQGELREELTSVQAERERAESLLSSGDDERERLEQAVANARQALSERQAELAAVEQEFRESHLHAADAEAKAKRLQSVAAEMKARIRRLGEAAEAAERDASRLDTRRRSIVMQIAELLRVIRGLRTQDTQVLAEASESGARRQSLEREVADLRETLAAIEAQQHARRGKLEGLEARLKVLEEAQAQAGESEGEDVTIEGALATVYEVLRVPRGLEEAIAAVLADQTEAYVFERQVDAISAIRDLVEQGGRRSAAIPLDSIKQTYPLSLMKEKGVMGVASRLVKYPARYEKLVNTLLGRVIVVQDVETAVRLLKRRLGSIVTADGILFDQSGLISGGRASSGRSFALAYDRDLESLPKEIARITHSLDATEREAEALRDKLRQAETALAALTREADSVVERRMRLQDSGSSRHQKLAQLKGEIRGLMANLTENRAQVESYRQQAQTLEHERSSLLEEAAGAEETARHLSRADGLFKDRRKVAEAAVNEAADALGRADAELRSLNVQKENAHAALARVQAQASAKEVQYKGLEMELTTLAETLARDGADLAALQDMLDELLDSIPGEEGSHHLEARQQDLHKQVMAGQDRLLEAERRTLETEAHVRRWETDVETLRQRMAEDNLEMAPDGTVRRSSVSASETDVEQWLITETDDGPSDLRPMAGGAIIDHDALEREIGSLRSRIRALGPVNVEAQVDYESLRERHDFLTGQMNDLSTAEQALRRAIQELGNLMRRKFEATFAEVAANFARNFNTFFGGGHARLSLTDPRDPYTSGIEIEARPPGKRTQSLAQLSGGEKSLTSVSLLFALLEVNPAPFCVLDEVDAMLDEANVGRFALAIKNLSERTQFVVITHNRRTIEQADSIYGISMGQDAASRVLSMRLADVSAQTLSEN